jgi:hypothetical protein
MPSRDASIDADIARANAWTQDDVNCARQGVAAHHEDASVNDEESNVQLLLIPELVMSEVSNQGDALIRVIERAVGGKLNIQYFNDTQMIRGLIRDHKLVPEYPNVILLRSCADNPTLLKCRSIPH